MAAKAAKSQFPVMKLRRFRTAGDQEQKQKQKTADIVFAQEIGHGQDWPRTSCWNPWNRDASLRGALRETLVELDCGV